MTLWNAVMLIIAIVAVSVVAYWVLYTTRLKTRERTIALKGRPPLSKEEGIAVATLEKERAHKSGSF
jgi:cell division septal protein FtsQ